MALFLIVLVLCTYQGDATFGSGYFRKPYVANSFSQSEYSARESDGRVAVTIVASRYYFYGSFSVKIKSSVNTKLTPYASSSDFDEGTQVVLFSSRQTKATAYIRINNDNKVENTEAFKVEILISRDVYDSGVRFGTKPSATVYIKNDDIAATHPPNPPTTLPPTSHEAGVEKVRLSQKVYRVKESDGFVVIKLLVSGYRRSSVQVGARAFVPTKFDLSAADGSDFKIGYYYFNFPPHANEATIIIPIFNDNSEEETESFAVSLLQKDKGIQIQVPFLAEVIIEDDDERPETTTPPPPQTTIKPTDPSQKPDDNIMVQFSQGEYMVDESAGYVSLKVILSGQRYIPISFNYRVFVSNTEFKASSADVQTGVFFAYVPGNQNVIYIKVQIFDDKLLEGTEAFGVQLSIPNHHKANGVKLGDPSGVTVFIKDDEKPPSTRPPTTKPPTIRPPTLSRVKVHIERLFYTVQESCTMLSVTLVVVGEVREEFTVGIYAVGHYIPSARADVDFESGIYRTTFKPGQSRSSVCIVIIDDDIREGNEKFRLLLAIPKSVQKNLNIWAGKPFFADVKIIDDPDDSMRLPVQLPPTMEERATMCICKDRPTPSPTTPPPVITTFIPSPSPSPPPIIMVSFKESSYTTPEGNGSITFAIQLSQAFDEPISVEFCTQESDPLSAEAGGDYTAISSETLTFAPGETCVSVVVSATDDEVHEKDETFVGSLKTSSSTPDNVLIGDPSMAVGTIIDDDDLIVRFLNDTSSAVESDGAILFTVISLVTSDNPFTVQVCTKESDPVSAEADLDYTSVVTNITFNNGDNSQVFAVPITDDDIAEADETFEVFLKNFPGGPYNVIFADPSVAVGTIFDNEIPSVEFLFNSTTVGESDGVATFTLISSFPFDEPFTVQVTSGETDPVSARKDDDYIPTVVNVTFPARVTTVDITVPVVPDLVIEDTEMFYVRIDELPDQPVTIAEQNTSLGIIIDDDTPLTVSFNTTEVRDVESSGSLKFILGTNIPAYVSFTVQVCSEDANLGPDLELATADDDYVSGAFDVAFGVGDTSVEVSINITDDSINEGSEAFGLVLKTTDDTPDLVEIVDPMRATGIIEDNYDTAHAEVYFNQRHYYIMESDRYIAINIVIARKNFYQSFYLEVRPSYIRGTESSQTASYTDFDSKTQYIEVQAQQSVVTTNISIYNDNYMEDTEAFHVELVVPPRSAYKGIQIGKQGIVTIYIKDDDVSLSFSQKIVKAFENDNLIQFTLSLLRPLDYPFEVEVSTSNISAFGGVDYNYFMRSVPFVSGSLAEVVIVDLINDDIAEPTEEFQIDITRITPGSLQLVGRDTTASGIILDDDEVTVTFESEEYRGCSADGEIVVTLRALKTASLPFKVNIWPVELPYYVRERNHARANVDFSANPVVIIFYPGETLKSGRIVLFQSDQERGVALKRFYMKLKPLQNRVNVIVGQQQNSIATITC